jgi:hypothetical protein
LWVGARLGGQSLDSGPIVLQAQDDEWRTLQRIEVNVQRV